MIFDKLRVKLYTKLVKNSIKDMILNKLRAAFYEKLVKKSDKQIQH